MQGIKTSLVGVLVVGLFSFAAHVVSADTIQVTYDAADSNVAAGQYAYQVSLDAAAVVDGPVGGLYDGAVIYDFNDYIINSAVILSQSGSLVGTGWALAYPGTGSAPLQTNGTLDALAAAAAGPAGVSPFVNANNLVVIYTGSSTVSGVGTMVVRFDSTLKNLPLMESMFASVDNSGANSSFGYAENSVLVPNAGAVPSPAPWLGGGALLAILGLVQARRARQSTSV
jgi:hypothetical protein